MKLADWARKQGIAYLTAYRWFKDGKLPVKAYQSDSGTIIVEDDEAGELSMPSATGLQNNDIFSLILKKVVEYSKNNATIEDFAAYVLSNFSLKLNSSVDSPRYSKNKPKPEDIQKHFQQFIPKGEKPKPKPNMFVTNPADLDALVQSDEMRLEEVSDNQLSSDTASTLKQELKQEFASYFDERVVNKTIIGGMGTEGMVSRMKLTPQNYTDSTNHTFRRLASTDIPDVITSQNRSILNNCTVSNVADDCEYIAPNLDFCPITTNGPTGAFKPTQKEIELAQKTFKPDDNPSIPKRRGRKSFKNLGKK